jgi:hypothetical protein
MRKRPYRPLPALRNAYSGVVHAQAECLTEGCGWQAPTWKNALGVGAVHARRYGHHVVAEQVVAVTYNRPEQAEA